MTDTVPVPPLTCGAVPVPAVTCNVVDAIIEVIFAVDVCNTTCSSTKRLVVVCACLVVELLSLDGVLELVAV